MNEINFQRTNSMMIQQLTSSEKNISYHSTKGKTKPRADTAGNTPFRPLAFAATPDP